MFCQKFTCFRWNIMHNWVKTKKARLSEIERDKNEKNIWTKLLQMVYTIIYCNIRFKSWAFSVCFCFNQKRKKNWKKERNEWNAMRAVMLFVWCLVTFDIEIVFIRFMPQISFFFLFLSIQFKCTANSSLQSNVYARICLHFLWLRFAMEQKLTNRTVFVSMGDVLWARV